MSGERAKSPAVVHVDLDGLSSIYRIHGWEYGRERDPMFESGLANLLDLFDEQGVRATLFLIAEDLKEAGRREMLEEAVRRGHDIASHSMTHRPFDGLDLAERRREIEESRQLISAELGVEVRGFRAPNFEIARDTLHAIEEAGYEYDSSCFPTPRFAARLGIDRVPIVPFRALDEGDLLELPLPSYAPLPVPYHPSYTIMLGGWYFRLGESRFRSRGAPLVLVFHLIDLAEPVPRDLLPGWKARLFTLSHVGLPRKRAVCGRIFEQLRRHYDLVDTAELLERCRPDAAAPERRQA